MKKVTMLVSGGIGSGKSYILNTFNAMGVPSYDADSRAKGLYDTDVELLRSVVAVAGRDVLDADGYLDRKALAAKIFSSSCVKERVEALVHPAVMRDFAAWRERQASDMVIMESAILLEHPQLLKAIDYKVVVTAPQDVRIKRVGARDNTTSEQVLSRISSQWSDERRVAMADFVIENDGVKPILPQIVVILEFIKNKEHLF